MNDNGPKQDHKILIFIIGVLVGAVISTASFLICVNVLGVNKSDSGQSAQMQGGTPPEMPSGSGSQNDQGNMPPEMPNSNSSNN